MPLAPVPGRSPSQAVSDNGSACRGNGQSFVFPPAITDHQIAPSPFLSTSCAIVEAACGFPDQRGRPARPPARRRESDLTSLDSVVWYGLYNDIDLWEVFR